MRLANALKVLALTGALALTGCPDNSSPSAPATPPPSAKPVVPIVPKAEVADWCKEHGVPESVCTRCNATLIADFQKKGDWCSKHDLPDSQCLTCHPDLKAKLEVMAPKSGEKK